MANIKSAEKRIKQTAKRQLRNRGVRSQLKTAVKQYRELEDERESLAGLFGHRQGEEEGRDPQERSRPLQVPPRPQSRKGEGSVKGLGRGSGTLDIRP